MFSDKISSASNNRTLRTGQNDPPNSAGGVGSFDLCLLQVMEEDATVVQHGCGGRPRVVPLRLPTQLGPDDPEDQLQ